MELPISESAQGFRENPDTTFFSAFILVGVPVRLCFNRHLFLKVKKGGYFASSIAKCTQPSISWAVKNKKSKLNNDFGNEWARGLLV